MKIIQSSLAVAAFVMVGLLSCASTSGEKNESDGATTQQAPTNTTPMLPAFKMTDVNGNTVDMASLKGKKVFVNLWATWCPPCRAEIPSIEGLASKIDQNNTIFVMLSLDENFQLAKDFAIKENLKVPVYYPADKLPGMFNTEGIPATFIFNENGELIKQNMGAADYDTDEYVNMLKSN